MAYAEICWIHPPSWSCSCGAEDLPIGASFWDADELECPKCGAKFDLELDGDTESGFFHTATEAEKE